MHIPFGSVSVAHSSVKESGCLVRFKIPLVVILEIPPCREFLQQGTSKSEVNVSAKVQEEVEKDVKNPTRYAFLAAQVPFGMTVKPVCSGTSIFLGGGGGGP